MASVMANGTGKSDNTMNRGEQDQLNELVRLYTEQGNELRKRREEIEQGLKREAQYKSNILELEDKERETTFDRASMELLKKRLQVLENEKLSLMSDKVTFQSSIDQIKAMKDNADKRAALLEKELSSVKAEKVASDAKAVKLAKDLKDIKEVALNENVRNTKEKLEAREEASKLELQLRDAKEQLEESLNDVRIRDEALAKWSNWREYCIRTIPDVKFPEGVVLGEIKKQDSAPLVVSDSSNSTSSGEEVIEPVSKKRKTGATEQKVECKDEEVNDEAIAMLLEGSSVGDWSPDEDDDYRPPRIAKSRERKDVSRTPRRRGGADRSGRKERTSTGTGKNGKKEKAANTCTKVELIGKIIRASDVLHEKPVTEDELEETTRDQRDHLLITGETGRQLKPGLAQLNLNNAMCNMRNALRWYEIRLATERGEEVILPKPTPRQHTPKAPKAQKSPKAHSSSRPRAPPVAVIPDFSNLSCVALEAELIKRYHSVGSTVTIEKLRTHSIEQNGLFLTSCMARTTVNSQQKKILRKEIWAILKKLFVYWGKEKPIKVELVEEDQQSVEA